MAVCRPHSSPTDQSSDQYPAASSSSSKVDRQQAAEFKQVARACLGDARYRDFQCALVEWKRAALNLPQFMDRVCSIFLPDSDSLVLEMMQFIPVEHRALAEKIYRSRVDELASDEGRRERAPKRRSPSAGETAESSGAKLQRTHTARRLLMQHDDAKPSSPAVQRVEPANHSAGSAVSAVVHSAAHSSAQTTHSAVKPIPTAAHSPAKLSPPAVLLSQTSHSTAKTAVHSTSHSPAKTAVHSTSHSTAKTAVHSAASHSTAKTAVHSTSHSPAKTAVHSASHSTAKTADHSAASHSTATSKPIATAMQSPAKSGAAQSPSTALATPAPTGGPSPSTPSTPTSTRSGAAGKHSSPPAAAASPRDLRGWIPVRRSSASPAPSKPSEEPRQEAPPPQPEAVHGTHCIICRKFVGRCSDVPVLSYAPCGHVACDACWARLFSSDEPEVPCPTCGKPFRRKKLHAIFF